MREYDAYKYNADETLLRGARWARDEEIMQVTRPIRLSDPACPVKSGLITISDGDTVYVDDSDTHSLIIGSTGSKKSRLFAMPMLEIIRRAGESVLVTDPKGELYDTTAQSFEDSGYRVYVINLREPAKSNGWNPLMLAREYYKSGDTEKAVSIVNDFAGAMMKGEQGSGGNSKFWEHTAISMLQGLSLMMVEEEQFFPDEFVNLSTLRHLAENFSQDYSIRNPGVLDLLDKYPEDSTARTNIMVASGGSEITFSNVKISYDAPMQRLYAQRALISLLSTQDVDFNRLGMEKTILYLIMPDEKTTLHKIVSLVVKLCYEQLIDLAQRQAGNALPVRVNFLLDEFSNLPAIPDMPAMISAARSRNIKFHLIIQGLYQLSSKYGADDAQTIKGNCGNWAFLTSRELPLLQEISDLCGQDAITGEKLITVSQLQRLNKERGEVLMLLGRQCPYIAHLADISEYVMPAPMPRAYPRVPVDMPPVRTIREILDALRKKKNEDDLITIAFDDLFG
ncbi:MAG: type IV secretory system conjugative DNA transfer family protein, partial [Clostridia bacterium]|nr:type IV secretory system conjugative DNA transfer family protein [Clostridia bacterium]